MATVRATKGARDTQNGSRVRSDYLDMKISGVRPWGRAFRVLCRVAHERLRSATLDSARTLDHVARLPADTIAADVHIVPPLFCGDRMQVDYDWLQWLRSTQRWHTAVAYSGGIQQ